MSSTYDYKMLVKGRKKDCYACYHKLGEPVIIYELGSDEKYEFAFEGEYYWDIIDPRELSERYDVEIMCNSFYGKDGSETARYEHYRNGERCSGEMPEILDFNNSDYPEDFDYEELIQCNQSGIED